MSAKPLLLAAAIAAFATAPVPAFAQDQLGYSLASQVPTLCVLTGDVYATSGDPATASAITVGGSATVAIDLAQPGAQEIARVGAACNGGSATVTIASDNGFRLVNGIGGANREIPYTVTVVGTPISAISAQSSYVENDVLNDVRRAVSITVGNLNFLLLAAGEYTDTLTLSVTPNS